MACADGPHALTDHVLGTQAAVKPAAVVRDEAGSPRRRQEVFYNCMTTVERTGSFDDMATTIGFRPTEDDERIIKAAMRPNEHTSDVIRRALRLLEREVWLSQARSDAERLAVEDVSDEADAW